MTATRYVNAVLVFCTARRRRYIIAICTKLVGTKIYSRKGGHWPPFRYCFACTHWSGYRNKCISTGVDAPLKKRPLAALSLRFRLHPPVGLTQEMYRYQRKNAIKKCSQRLHTIIIQYSLFIIHYSLGRSQTAPLFCLPLKGKTKGGAAKNSACTTGLRSSHGFRQYFEPGTGNHRIGDCVNSPLNKGGGGWM